MPKRNEVIIKLKMEQNIYQISKYRAKQLGIYKTSKKKLKKKFGSWNWSRNVFANYWLCEWFVVRAVK